MKRVSNLMPLIADYDNLQVAFMKAANGKQCSQEVIEFRNNYEERISDIRDLLISGKTRLGNYRFFYIIDPKKRKICAAPLEDRIVHHAIMNVCHDYFDRRLIDDTYATRKEKGVYAALNKAVKSLAQYNYVMKLDIKKYYDSIDHDVLKSELQRIFKDKDLLALLYSVIDSYNVEDNHGLPIGNLTSQYFANTYLCRFDHYVKEQLRTPIYIRYMDDMLLASNSLEELRYDFAMMRDYAERMLHLTFKIPVYRKSFQGVSFLGYKVLPFRLQLNGRSKRRYRSKLLKYSKLFMSGRWDEREYQNHLLPLVAFANHAESKAFRMDCQTKYSIG